MEKETAEELSAHSLGIQIEQSEVPVSYMSSLLRVLQAALREVALNTEVAREQFNQQPQPILVMTRISSQASINIQFSFNDPLNHEPIPGLSSLIFNSFLDRLGEYVMSLPQPSLWGGAARSSPNSLDSEVSRRMDQIYAEVRRAPKVLLMFHGRTLEIEGSRLEIT